MEPARFLFLILPLLDNVIGRSNPDLATENIHRWLHKAKDHNLTRKGRDAEDSYFSLNNLITDPDTGILQPTSKFLDEHGALFPVIFNLAENAKITANATCGLERPEVYCKLVEHVAIKPPQCGICDGNSSDPSRRHPIENAIDGSPRWWQSPTVANGNEYEYVTIIIDLRQSYQVAYVILKAANSPRPAAWELAKSIDGVTYKPWQFFARTDEECMDLFGIGGSFGRTKFQTDSQVICSTEYSRIHPLEDGEIHTSLINDRPGVSGPSQELVDFTTARYIRFRFVKLHTLTSDLRKLLGTDRLLQDSSETRRYFYSIKDISVGGQCICFGHARDCPLDEEGIPRCQCAHNTCGDSCEKCCPLYNQRPWKAGTGIEPAVCEGCQCHGHADECYYEDEVARAGTSLALSGRFEGGGVCLNCQHNTTGINCEKCKPGFFRPLGVDKFNKLGCLLCECHDIGPGSTGECVIDEESMFGDYQPGDCICHPGFAGPKCDRCAPGFRNYPICEPCPCNFAGSKNGEACEGDCRCKDNVEGERCDRCKPGFFNLDAENPQGCSPCFCFGVTDQCESAGWNTSKIASLDGWILTDSTGSRILYPTYINGTPIVAADDTYELDVFYWLAPKDFTGNRLSSYGGKLEYSISFVKGRGDLTGSYTADVDVIMEGNGVRIGRGERFFREGASHHLTVNLQPQGWHHVSLNGIFGEYVSKERFMTLLANVEKLMIRGTYHTRQLESRLLMASMTFADENSKHPAPLLSVEQCSCPQGYTGLSCETCASGHRRINQTLFNGMCVPCDCHAHATSCDPFTGECRDCQHNAAGFFCEQCAPGHYGDARSGDPNSCKPCGCPLLIATNNFSPSCISGSNINLPDDYICTDCPAGYMGSKCESCSDGFFGNPLVPGNFCQPCFCNGNIDLAALGNCERTSGRCLKCIGNTEGFSCENCKKGFYGSALRHDCKACACNAFGSEHSDCDQFSGQCVCKPGYEGRKCDRCSRGFGQISQGCLPCQCNLTGSTSSECDGITGQCPCKSGVFGLHCKRCQEGYYGFSSQGCRQCLCETFGSVNQTCRGTDGQCFCKANVTGRSCNECSPVHWGIQSGQGCAACDCDPTGSMSAACDLLTGQCRCKPGVTGRTCHECQVGYFGLNSRGCTKCQKCPAPGQVCDRKTGECVCPPLTIGARCEKCAANSFAYHPMTGCKACQCNMEGSTGPDCDEITGNCDCKEGYVGAKCDQCRVGYFNFPSCLDCRCNMNGTEPASCKDGKCKCDSVTGQCSCKKHVEGADCSRCKEKSFTLLAGNPEGCFPCFCSGKSDRCWQSSYIWRVNAHQGHSVNVTYLGRPRGYFLTNRTLAMDVVTFDNEPLLLPQKLHETPLYWTLPSQFLGDRILSYNGKLKFKLGVDYMDNVPRSRSAILPLHAFPLALLQGNSRLILDYKTHHIPPHGVYEIHLHESKWQNRQAPQVPVTRDLMMVALQNVQHFLIRSHTLPWPKTLHISDVQMEYAGKSPSDKVKGQTAWGVEMCACPAGYNGTSCQNPSPGYFRSYPADFLDNPNPLILLGEAKACQCNNLSRTCEPDSGRCIGCQQNTAGDHCERCASGHYGDPKRKITCQRCACPTLEQNYSEKCAPLRTASGNESYICTGCPQGFVGDRCQQCDRGYFGNPTAGVACQPCSCNEFGSEHRTCDTMTGQCKCRPGILGRDCSRCQPGHVISSMGCINCMHDQCIKDLFNQTENLNSLVDNYNTSGLHLAAVTRLNRLEQRFSQLNIMVQSAVGESASYMDNIFPSIESQFEFDREIRRVMLAANKSATDAIQLRQTGLQKQNLIDKTCADIPLIENKIKDLVRSLRAYLQSENSQGTLNIQLILSEAERLFVDISRLKPVFSNSSALGELSAITAVLSEIESLDTPGDLIATVGSRYKELRNKLDEMTKYVEKDISMTLKNTKRISEQTRQRLTSSQEGLASANRNFEDTNKVVSEQELLLRTAKADYKNASRNFEDAGSIVKLYRENLAELENISGILENLNPEYRDLWLVPAQEHSLELARKAEMLDGLFATAKTGAEDPLRAAHAYDQIVDSIREAENITEQTQTTLDEVNEILAPSLDAGLNERANEALNESMRLELDAKRSLDDEVFNLKEVLDEETGRLDGVNATNLRTAQESDKIGERLDQLLEYEGLSSTISVISNRITDVSDKVNGLSTAVDERMNSVQNQIKPKFDKIKELDAGSLDQTERLVQETGRDVGNLNRSIADLEIISRGLDDLHRDLAAKIQRLRNSVLTAKQAASSLQISLSTDSRGMCRRSYEPPIVPSSANNIVLTYSTTAPEKPALLMYIGNPRSYALQRDFMAVEVVGRRVRFIWNVGVDTKEIQHPDVKAKPGDPGFLEPNTWYRIEINRVKNLAQLRVTPMSSASSFNGAPALITGASNASVTRMDLNRSSEMFVGGLPHNVDIPEVKAREFFGCLGQITIDGHRIGLWNYKTSEGCSGCAAGVTEMLNTDDTSFRFNGNGYASAPQIRRYNNKRYTIALTFRTFDEDALLFLCANEKEKNGDFISLEIRDGKVVFQFYLGGQNHLLVSTNRRFNTGQFVNIRAERDGFFADLRVDDDHIKATLPNNKPDGLELATQTVYLGGVPPGFSFNTRYNITYKSLLGCLKDIQIDITSLDLLSKSVYLANVEQGCAARAVRDVSFSQSNGYLILPGKPLPVNGSVAFSFATGEVDGLLLASVSDNYKFDQHYWTASLQNGRLVFLFNNGNSAVKLQVDKYYDDRMIHTVSIVKKRKRVEITVDDVYIDSLRLTGTGPGIMSDTIYVGGAPSTVDLSAIAASARSFRGCISELIINRDLIGFEQLKSFEHAAVGRCELESALPTAESPGSALPQALALSRTRTSRQCGQPAKLKSVPQSWRAINFGSASGFEDSRVHFSPPRHELKQFNMTISFRTYHPNGVIFYVENPNGGEAIVVSLRHGQMMFTAIDDDPQVIKISRKFDDGNWHSIHLERKHRRWNLIADEGKEEYVKVSKKFHVDEPMYLGGLPAELRAPAGVSKAGFRGCMANVTFNERSIELMFQPTIQGVSPCYEDVEPATFFQGSGYAVYDEKFKPGGKLQLEVEFRSTASSGELALLYDPLLKSYIQMRFVDNEVIFNVSNKGRSFHVSRALPTVICDGQWHRIKSLFMREVIMLDVDNTKQELAYAPQADLGLIPEGVPLYLGGRPASIPPHNVPKTPNFIGCIRQLIINGFEVDFAKVAVLNSVLLNSCPVHGAL